MRTAVVGTATGGVVEVVDDGVTGLLVPFEPRDDGTQEPRDPGAFASDFARRLNDLVESPDRTAAMGRAGMVARTSSYKQARLEIGAQELTFDGEPPAFPPRLVVEDEVISHLQLIDG